MLEIGIVLLVAGLSVCALLLQECRDELRAIRKHLENKEP